MYNDAQFKKDFDNYLCKKTPVITDYQYLDDYVEDCMSLYRTILKVSRINYTWLDIAQKRLEYVRIAEAANLPYRDKWFEFEMNKYKENLDGIW